MHANPLIMWLNRHTSVNARDALVDRHISAPALISFFEQEIASVKSKFQETCSRPYNDVGCIRLWLEWSNNALLHKGFLVATGRARIHQLEGDGSHSVYNNFPQDQASGKVWN